MICGPLRSGGAQYARFPAASPPHENPLAKALAITSATILIPGSSPFQLSRRRCADMSGPSARTEDAIVAATRTATAMYNLFIPRDYVARSSQALGCQNASSFVLLAVGLLQPYSAPKLALAALGRARVAPRCSPCGAGLLTHRRGSYANLVPFCR
jgi:hypothetical protein